MVIDQVEEGFFDRWCVMFDLSDMLVLDILLNDSGIGFISGREDDLSIFIMNNYFGIGIGVELCLDFYFQREEVLDKFYSR